MSRIIYVGVFAFLSLGMATGMRSAHTGHLFLTLTDIETGCPITNATVTVRCQTEFNIGRTLESHFTKTTAVPDSNGVAHVEFAFYDPDFQWWVDAPGHYSRMFGFGYGDEQFGREVVESDYADVNTNTVEGLAKYNELVSLYGTDYCSYAAKFSPKSITYTNNVIRRTVALTPKHNPQPMYAYGERMKVYLPIKNPTLIITNGVEALRYKPVDFDLKECDLVPDVNDDSGALSECTGKIGDFHVERYAVVTNGVETNFGWIEFPSACGAYIIKKPGSENFPVIYEADTNRTFLAKIPFEYCYTNGSLMHASRIVNSDECMVLRTRATTNEAGRVVDCNYAKITGPMSILKVLSFESLIFNPRPNDPNLEFDVRYNQSSYRGGCCP